MGRNGQAPVREAAHMRSPRPPSSRAAPYLSAARSRPCRGARPPGARRIHSLLQPSARRLSSLPRLSVHRVPSLPWLSARSSTELRGVSSSSDGLESSADPGV
ncbi:hypothetical protein PAHAL_9G272300 [Panicum hallii]|uniref:Uncharacterized protein n=1 Tax=Panicum hallii TaxID=206008 RepID=A0A2S3IMA5_9POAL|nr:hypothetical protein PAHAL_9G272300 [Panicum hallii]